MSLYEIKTLAESSAIEDATKDLVFSGNAALAKLPVSDAERSTIRQALIFYAGTASIRTVNTLKLHGLLNCGGAK